MSTEKQVEELKKAFGVFIDFIAYRAGAFEKSRLGAAPSAASEPEAPPAKADPKADPKAELKTEAKTLAAAIIKGRGKEALTKLLEKFCAKKFSDLGENPDVLRPFISDAQNLLSQEPEAPAEADVDMLGDETPAVVEKPVVIQRTLEDVKALLIKVNNTASLGKEVTKQLLAEFGVMRLPELKAEKYNEAYAITEKALANAGAL